MTHCFCVLSALLSVPAGLPAGHWPQFMGPDRNGIAEGTALSGKWPEGGPRRVWRVVCGRGHGGPAVSKGVVVLMERSKSDPGKLSGRTRQNDIVVFEGPEGLSGNLCKIRITGSTPLTLFGTPL